jgi:tetratricopeptide (TPR) repeat protein
MKSALSRSRWLVPALAGGLLVAHSQENPVTISSIETSIRAHDYDQALQLARSGLTRTPKDFRLWTLEGITFSLQGKRADALTAFDEAITLSPNYLPALKGEVQLLYPAGDKRAIPLLKKILQSDPRDETAHEMLGALERKREDCQAAIGEFSKSANSIESHPPSLEAYGYCLVHLGKMQEAVPVFEKLSALLPDQTYPKYDLAVVLVALKQNEDAIQVLDPLLTTSQQDPDILSLASEAYEHAGNTSKSVSLLREAIVQSPATVDYYISFASLCYDHDSFQVGIDMLNAGLKYIPDNPSLYISRGLLYAQLAQFDNAEADFNKAEQLDSAQSIGAYAVDLAELQKNNPDEALSKVRSQLKAHPESPLLHYLLAKLLMNQAQAPGSAEFREALRSALLAVKLKPDLASARDLLAGIYVHSAQYNLAIEQCRIALKDSPSDETAAYHLLIALRHSGQGSGDEIKGLVKQLSAMHQAALQQESDKKRYRLVEQNPPPQ